ncbi:alpha/beta hydrolase [Herbidospora sp. NBRC 101105]|uniref:alpha/beta hydrolase n=1 Tax=Herbidospora sp. NBRC 101105 TaxID=3032195 RepID=UPI0024A3C864|nr:alpha/beta hydrolase [Herbidospora sp. NBRC 101105]GLX94513.1 esterase [Herbidospora sp. NBRC 101105]
MTLHPNLDPDLRAALEALPPLSYDLNTADLAEIRRARAAACLPPGAGTKVSDVDADGLRLRVYRPAGAGDEPLPCLYWIHGGGMIIGLPEMDDSRISRFVEALGCMAVSVDYRLAPEHPYPIPLDDCYRGLLWTAENAAALGVDPDRLAIGGNSAGAGLAAGLALLARDRGGPRLRFQLLLCPMLDDRDDTASAAQFEEAVSWPRGNNRFAWKAYLGDLTDVPVYAAPARATDLSGLPPAYVDVGDLEVFRDEDALYALRLAAAGVPVEFHLWPGAFHGFAGALPDTPIGRRSTAEQIEALRRGFVGGDI